MGDEMEKLLDVSNGDINDEKGHVTFVLIFSIFTAVLGSFAGGCAMGYSSPVQSSLITDLRLSTAEFSLFGSLLTVGGLFGALFCGKITDYIGRRATMGLSSYLFLIGWLAIACSQGSWSLDVGRLALGFANGITAYAVPVYIAEITPKDLRGGSVLLHQVMLCGGIAVVFMSGVITSWQILALIGTLPCLIQLVGIYFIPESPRWLIRKQYYLALPVKSSYINDYEVVLRRLRGADADISEEAAAIKANTEAMGDNVKHRFSNVFQMKYANALTMCLGLMALAGFGGTFGILFYATATFESAGFSGTIGSIAMGLIQLPPVVVGVFLMDKFGRRPLLLFSAAGMGIGTMSLALSFLLKEHGLMTDFSPYLALFGILKYKGKGKAKVGQSKNQGLAKKNGPGKHTKPVPKIQKAKGPIVYYVCGKVGHKAYQCSEKKSAEANVAVTDDIIAAVVVEANL
ncbi:hypothetical protein KSS87_016941, partial [Heliosperma pusillum]